MTSSQKTVVRNFWIPLGGLLLVFTLDRFAHYLLGDITLAPLVAILVLAGSAFFLKPRSILFWTPFYALLCFLLLTAWRYSFVPGAAHANEVFLGEFVFSRGLVRALTVFLAGVLSACLSQQKQRLQRSVEETVAVMTALPLGVLISDRSGLITFANEKVALFLGVEIESLVGSSYFSLLASSAGNTIEKYSEVAEIPGEKSGRINFYLRKKPQHYLVARLFSLQSVSGRLVATVFDEPAPLADPCLAPSKP